MASQIKPRAMPPKRQKRQKRNIALAGDWLSDGTMAVGFPKALSTNNYRVRCRIKPMSDKRSALNVVYERAVRRWRAFRTKLDGFQCQYVYASGRRCQKKAHRRPHHVKRRGKNLCDARFFLAVCMAHHDWIEQHAREAMKKGYIVREYEQHSNGEKGLPGRAASSKM